MALCFCIFLQRDHYISRQLGQGEWKKKRVTVRVRQGLSFVRHKGERGKKKRAKKRAGGKETGHLQSKRKCSVERYEG